MQSGIVDTITYALAFGIIALVSTVPPPLIEGLQSFNFTIPFNGTSNSNLTTLGYDPSGEWQKEATVEVWTGGSQRKPVNVGNLNSADLYRDIEHILDNACPPNQTPYGGFCSDNIGKWYGFRSRYLFRNPADVRDCAGYVRINSAQWATEALRVFMMNMVGDVYAAYTEQAIGTNCYEVPGQGKFCNVPQYVRTNLPDTSPAQPGWQNFYHAEISGCPDQFSSHGNLKPCGTRSAVDVKIDRYKNAMEAEFPEWKGRFSRDTRVIINGFKSCTDEP